MFKNEDKYKGEFKDGRPCGMGEMKYAHSILGPNGDGKPATYTGQFKAGKRHGSGAIAWDDGCYFEGTWKQDQRVQGYFKMPNTNVFV